MSGPSPLEAKRFFAGRWKGFRFRRFRSWLRQRGVRLGLGCASETRVAPDGTLLAAIRLDFCRLPVATLRLAIRVERD